MSDCYHLLSILAKRKCRQKMNARGRERETKIRRETVQGGDPVRISLGVCEPRAKFIFSMNTFIAAHCGCSCYDTYYCKETLLTCRNIITPLTQGYKLLSVIVFARKALFASLFLSFLSFFVLVATV